MEMVQTVRKTDLARNTRHVIRNVQRGQTALIESHGELEAAIMDIVDYRIMRAVIHYYAQRPDLDVKGGLADQAVKVMTDSQAQYNLVFAHYLAGSISLARAAELLKLPWLDLRTRCLRLDVPLRTAPADKTEAEADSKVALTWAAQS